MSCWRGGSHNYGHLFTSNLGELIHGAREDAVRSYTYTREIQNEHIRQCSEVNFGIRTTIAFSLQVEDDYEPIKRSINRDYTQECKPSCVCKVHDNAIYLIKEWTHVSLHVDIWKSACVHVA